MHEKLLIKKIEVYAYSIPMKPLTIALGTLHEAKNFLVKIHTNEGITGYGEGAPFPMIVGETQETCMAAAKDFSQLLLNKDALNIGERMQDLHNYMPFHFTCKSAFDMALYDIASRHSNLPLYKFLGGEKKILLTDETIYVEDAEQMIENAKAIAQKNPPFIKVKVGKNDNAEKDISCIQEIRKVINDIPLRLDANQGWSVDNAIKVLNMLADANIQFCEQPVIKHDLYGLRKVKRNSAIKIMADESCFTFYDAFQLIEQDACDYINIKLAKSGGITEAASIANVAAHSNMNCMLGGMMESRLALSANVHFAYAKENIVFYDMDYNFNHLADPVVGGAIITSNYEVAVNDSPGIGAEVDDSFLNKCGKLVFE